MVGKSIRITFYEVHGKKCYDLLSDRNIVHLRSDAHENMHVRGARSIELCPLVEPTALVEVLREALSLRSSKVTERNPISSRSHAVCTIELLDMTELPAPAPAAVDRSLTAFLATKGGDAAPPLAPSVRKVLGKITLVDLAGSERNYETTQMTSAQHKESADINFALMALKDCFRAYHNQLTGHLLSLQERVQEKLNSGRPGAHPSNPLAPNLFNATTNTSGIVKSIHSVGIVSGTKATSLSAAHAEDTDENQPADPDAAAANAPGGGASAGGRIPFRSSTLTKVLKECFTSGPNHRTTIVATLSPTPIDLQHSLNTLNHVVLMCPELQQLTHRLTVEVPLNLHLQMQNRFNAQAAHSTAVGSGLSTKHVGDWSAEEVIAWLATAERGRFKHVVLPPGIDGRGVLMLSETNMVDLFAAQDQNTARGLKEGAAWVETVADDRRKVRRLGRALWSALRREMQSTLARESVVLALKK